MTETLEIQLRHYKSTLGDRGAFLVKREGMTKPVWVPKAAFIAFEQIGGDADAVLVAAEISRVDAEKYHLEVGRDAATADMFGEAEG